MTEHGRTRAVRPFLFLTDFMPNIPPALQHTPWGATQHYSEIAPGISQLSTAGHGGLHLSTERQLQVPPALLIETFAGLPWYEEDCDWALVALAFPDHFDGRSLHHAIGTVRSYHEKVKLDDYLQGHVTGQAAAKKAAVWFAEHKQQWEFGCQHGGGDFCGGMLNTVDRTKHMLYRCKDWPHLKVPFTLDQLRAAMPGIELKEDARPIPIPVAA